MGSGLQVEIGTHVFDKLGYLAGKDEDRLADLNDAFRDPGIKAVIATRGGKGAYRIADGIDFEAVRKQSKLFIGFSEHDYSLSTVEALLIGRSSCRRMA